MGNIRKGAKDTGYARETVRTEASSNELEEEDDMAKKYTLQEKEAAIALSRQGYKNSEVSRQLGISRSTIAGWLRSKVEKGTPASFEQTHTAMEFSPETFVLAFESRVLEFYKIVQDAEAANMVLRKKIQGLEADNTKLAKQLNGVVFANKQWQEQLRIVGQPIQVSVEGGKE